MNTFGNKLKQLRQENNLTQKELAEKLCVTIPTLSHWECGYQEPSIKDIDAICDLFDISADYLLGRKNER